MRAGIVVLGFGFSLLALGALADMVVAVKEAPAAAKRPSLRLVWVDVHKIAEAVRPVAFAETTILLESAGVDLEWEKNDGRQRDVRDGEVQVVLLPEPMPPLRRHIMGAAQPGAYGVRVVWVFLASVREALGLPRRASGLLRPIEMRRLARALARVILHEVVHVTDPARPHAARGLLAARLDRPFLESGRLEIETELVPVFRAAAEVRETPVDEGLMAVRGGDSMSATMAPIIAD